jgi:hypothetical protein
MTDPMRELAYGLKPSGHGSQLLRSYVEPPIHLVEYFFSWHEEAQRLKNDEKWEERRMRSALRAAGKAMRQGVGISEIEAIALHPRIDKMHLDTLSKFISAAYEISKEPVITVAIDLPVYGIGYKCSKVLVNAGNQINHFGSESTGILINQGTAGSSFGQNATGVIINLGTVDDMFAELSNALVINAGISTGYCGRRGEGMVVNLGTAAKCGYWWEPLWDDQGNISPNHILGRGQVDPNILRAKTHHAGYFFLAEPAERMWSPLGAVYERSQVSSAFISYIEQLVDCAKRSPDQIVQRFGNAGKIRAQAMALVNP